MLLAWGEQSPKPPSSKGVFLLWGGLTFNNKYALLNREFSEYPKTLWQTTCCGANKPPLKWSVAVCQPKIFQHISNVPIPAGTERFFAKRKFILGTGDDVPVKISHIDFWFDREFLTGDGKIEKPSNGGFLACMKLTKLSKTELMFSELGGKGRTETLLSSIYALVLRQGHGQPGDLLVDGWWNLFVAYGWTIGVRWDGSGWCFIATKVASFWGAEVFIFCPTDVSINVLA